MQVPVHVAIIPDGNRRWAKSQGIPDSAGHQEGAQAARGIMEAARDLGVKYLTIWSASKDNLKKRSKLEVLNLSRILTSYLQDHLDKKTLENNQTRFLLLGDWYEILKDENIRKASEELMDRTKHFTERTLTILFGYDGKTEMLGAVRTLQQSGREVTEESLQDALLTSQLPAVDLLIRTGGEPHNSSGFLMWQTADSQLYFTHTLWPEFSKEEFASALEEFRSIERRMGK